jgi:hypothetical protein
MQKPAQYRLSGLFAFGALKYRCQIRISLPGRDRQFMSLSLGRMISLICYRLNPGVTRTIYRQVADARIVFDIDIANVGSHAR